MRRNTAWLLPALALASSGCDLDWSRNNQNRKIDPVDPNPAPSCEGREGERIACAEISEDKGCGTALCKDERWDTTSCTPLTVFFADRDGDGIGGASLPRACDRPRGSVSEGGDCNDDDARQSPKLAETCDSLDNDCNDKVDDGPDPDRDGVMVCDNCPNDGNPTQTDLDADGLGWACDDLVELSGDFTSRFDEDPPAAASDANILRAMYPDVGEDLVALTWGVLEWAENGKARGGTVVIDGRSAITEVFSVEDWVDLAASVSLSVHITDDRTVLVSDGTGTYRAQDGQVSLAFDGSPSWLNGALDGRDLFTLRGANEAESLHRWQNGKKEDLLQSDATLGMSYGDHYVHFIKTEVDGDTTTRSLHVFSDGTGWSAKPSIDRARTISRVGTTQASAPGGANYYCEEQTDPAHATLHWLTDREEITPITLDAQTCSGVVRVTDSKDAVSWVSYPVPGGYRYLETYFPRALASGDPIPDSIWAVHTVGDTTYVRSESALYRKVGTALELVHAPLPWDAYSAPIEGGLAVWSAYDPGLNNLTTVTVLTVLGDVVKKQTFTTGELLPAASPQFANVAVSSRGDWFGIVQSRDYNTQDTIEELWRAGPDLTEPTRLVGHGLNKPIAYTTLNSKTLYSCDGHWYDLDLTSTVPAFSELTDAPVLVGQHTALAQSGEQVLLSYRNANDTFGLALWNGSTVTRLPALAEVTSISGATFNGRAFWVQYQTGTRALAARVEVDGTVSSITWAGSELATSWTSLHSIASDGTTARKSGAYMSYLDSIGLEHLVDVDVDGATLAVRNLRTYSSEAAGLTVSGDDVVAICFWDDRGCLKLEGQTSLGQGVSYQNRFYWVVGKTGGAKYLWKPKVTP